MAIDCSTNHRASSVRSFELLAVLGAIVLALGLRLFGRANESIWYDEAFSLEMARASYWDLITGETADPGNPAGYFMMLRAWFALWGSTTIETARAFSGLVGALAVPAVWLLARLAEAKPATRLLACLLVAVDPPLVYLGQEARAFELMATLGTLAVAAALAIERYDSKWAWLGFTLAGALMVHVHYYGFFVLVVLGLDLLVWAWGGDWARVAKLALAALCVALAFAPYFFVFLWQLRQGATRSVETWWQHFAVMPSFSVAGRTLIWKQDGLRWVIALDLLVIAGVFLPLAWFLMRRRDWPRMLASFVLGLPLLVLLVAVKAPMINVHYLSVILPTLMLLLAWGLLSAWPDRPWLVGSIGLLIAALMVAALGRMYLTRHKSDWRGAAAIVAQEGPTVPIYFYEDIGATPFRYYRPEQPHELILDSPGADGAGWRPRVLNKMLADPKGFWLVLYLTNSNTIAELPGVRKLLEQSWEVREINLRDIALWRCQPRAAP